MSTRFDPNSFGFLVTDVARLWRATMEREIGRSALPVTAAEARVLANVARLAPVRQNRLAAVIGVAPMSLTGFLDRLEAAGLILREADPSDRRAKTVTLTPAADDVLDQLAAVAARVRTEVEDGIGAAEMAAFNRVAKELRDRLVRMRHAALEEEQTR